MPDWAQRIEALRRKSGLSQGDMARRLDCSAMTISRWERGLMPPSSDYFIRLGNLAGQSGCWFFWEKAGLESADVVRSLPEKMRSRLALTSAPELESARAGSGAHRTVAPYKGDLIAIPLLKATAGTHGHLGDKNVNLDRTPGTSMMGAPRDWCPNPAYTSLLRVKGHSMQPLIQDGSIVAVDSFQTDREDLDGKVVIVSNEKKGLCVSHFRHYKTLDVLEPENREYEAIVLDKNSGWRIIGRVLWWIGVAP
jgi:transcriptional regulator with XRE-family HTH domain